MLPPCYRRMEDRDRDRISNFLAQVSAVSTAHLLRPHSTMICSTWRAHIHGELRQHVLRHAPLAKRPEDPEKCIGTFTELDFACIDLQALGPPDEQKQKNLTRRTSCKQQQGLCRLTMSLAEGQDLYLLLRITKSRIGDV